MRDCLSSHFMVTAHNHTTLLLVWNRGNFKVIQEVPCMGIEGSEVHPLFVKVLDRSVVAWLEDGSIVVFAMARDGTLKRQRTLNGHIQGTSQNALLAAICQFANFPELFRAKFAELFDR